MTSSKQKLQSAYQHCLTIAKNHYENFPVASRLLSPELRAPISIVYAFARTADDFADEGSLTSKQRLERLNDFTTELELIENSISAKDTISYCSDNPIFIALADVIKEFQIPIILFHDLLHAFKADVTTTRYQNFEDIMTYCQYSAAPVGRILLHLNKSATEETLAYSDAICNGLQLINFYQDIHQDIIENDRLYLPMNEMKLHQVTIDDLKNMTNNSHTQALIQQQLIRARQLYTSGQPLCSYLSGRFALEIRAIYAGGYLILKKLEENTHSIYQRPRLSHRDKFKILWYSLFHGQLKA